MIQHPQNPTEKTVKTSLGVLDFMEEHRDTKDRRSRKTSALSLYTIMGRRVLSGRRKGDKPGYVDLYHPALFLVLIGIVLLSLMDAYFTLEALSVGGKEINPAMCAVLGLGIMPFVLIKLSITGLGLALLCLHKNFPHVKRIIAIILIGYMVLLTYHLYLMQFR